MDTCTTKLYNIGLWTIARLPENISKKLPSRGMVMVEGRINGVYFQTPLEPDGKGSHWFRVDDVLLKKINAKAGDTIDLKLGPIDDWPDPKIPKDVDRIFNTLSIKQHWDSITPNAKWEWIRWIQSTGNKATREKRINLAIAKLAKGEKRPCCFNRNMCCVPGVSKSGVLMDSSS
ncbi:DUF1905 domain-containing protein [Candidatus Woesebacteria bacterium]|nr:MAG: DUF1905 domain-containing protein [Candidatus Woesebacteria bacterium]